MKSMQYKSFVEQMQNQTKVKLILNKNLYLTPLALARNCVVCYAIMSHLHVHANMVDAVLFLYCCVT